MQVEDAGYEFVQAKKKKKKWKVFLQPMPDGKNGLWLKDGFQNFFSNQCIKSARLNRLVAPKLLPWQQDGNGDHNVFMVLATWGLRSRISGDRTLPRARRAWAKSLHTRQQQNTEELWQNRRREERERERDRRERRERERDGRWWKKIKL